MRSSRASFTSELVAATRALYTLGPPELATVDDPAAFELLPAPFRLLLAGIEAVPFGARLSERVAGRITRGLTYGIPLRTAIIDDAVRRSVREGLRQLVVLGAGLDGRAYRLPELRDTTVFEVDHPNTQRDKRDKIRLQPLAREVRYAPIDFERDTLDAVLKDAGFDAAAASVWIWEGVIMYLTPAAVTGTLDAIARLAAPSSRVACTYLPIEYGPRWARGLGTLAAKVVGESLQSNFSSAQLADLFEARGFDVEDDAGARELARRYWPAERAPKMVEWERTLVARRQG